MTFDTNKYLFGTYVNTHAITSDHITIIKVTTSFAKARAAKSLRWSVW